MPSIRVGRLAQNPVVHIRITVRGRHGMSRDVAVTAPAGTPLSAVRTQLIALLDDEPSAELWSGTRLLPATAPLGGPDLRTGDVVRVGDPGLRDTAAGAVLCLHVVGGPDAGQVIALPRGILTLGRGGDCDLVLTDPDVSRRHASLTVTGNGVTVRDLHSTNGTTVDAELADTDGACLTPGAMLRIGDSFLSIREGGEAPAAVRATPGGQVLVNRPPRVRADPSALEVSFPVPGGASGAQRIQWIAAGVPAAAGVVLAMAMHSAQFLVFALLSPVVILASSLGDRVHWRRSRRRDAASLRRRESSACAEAATGLAHEVALRRRTSPDPPAVRAIASAPGLRLWERRRTDADALTVRVGLTDLPSTLLARRGSAVYPAGVLGTVPITVDLRAGPIGLAAPRGVGLGTARWLVTQLAVLHSPEDLGVALLLSDGAGPAWTWARWLPHLHQRVATTAAQRQALLAELAGLVEQRLGARRLARDRWAQRWLLVVVDRVGELIDQPALSALLAAGPSAGITAVCLDEHERQLPASCAASAVAVGETGTRLRVTRTDAGSAVEAVGERVTQRWAESVARDLAPLADCGADPGAALQQECRLVDLLGIEDFDVRQLIARWNASDAATASTVAGLGIDGAVHLDLVRDGPHALIAGTTGAGKSELLQSLVAGLAANYPPEAIAFLLIDYKGGAAFADCARLPHTVGLVTDLDTQLTGRALSSLHSELARREQLFARVGAIDLAGYRASVPAGEQLGRLVLVVDEFAALAEELPGFVTGLVAIAQRGRSLGVHLVLATQRPGGVVSPEIRANATMRVALRVADQAESCDIIGTDHGAHIDPHTPGRAFLRIGGSLTQFQTARVGGPARDGTSRDILVAPLSEWLRADGCADEATAADGKTELQLLVDALREAAVASGREPPRAPWLPPLSGRLRADALPRAARASSVRFGMVDDPDSQSQPPAELDLAAGGSLLFAGGPRSGRSTALVTIATIAAEQLGTDELAIYAIDCAGGALGTIANLPHCATAATDEPFELVAALLRRVEAEVIRRQLWLAERGADSVAELLDAGHPVPVMLCLIDGWERFAAAAEDYDAGRSVEVLVRLLRTAASAGLTVVLGGDRSTLAARLSGSVATKFVLSLAERSDFALAGIPAGSVPREMRPGRAIRAGDAAEVQLAFVGDEPSRTEQARYSRLVAARQPPGASRLPNGCAPIRLRALPARVSLADMPVTPQRFVLGAGGDAAEALSVDLFAGAARLLVAGPPRSGRSSVLCSMLVQAVRHNVAVVVAAPRRSALCLAAEARGITVLEPGACAGAVVPTTPHRTLLLVDDSESFLDTAVGDAMGKALQIAPAGLAAVVAANSDDLSHTYRGVAVEVRRSRCVLVLQPGPGDGDLLGRRLTHRRGPTIAGRGALIGDRAWGTQFAAEPIAIQVALP